jgi:hypothetical protein
MNVRLLLIGILNYGILQRDFNIDLMQFRLIIRVDTSLTWQFFLVFFIQLLQRN